MTERASSPQVYRIVVKASAAALWEAITSPAWTERYGYGGRVDYDLRPGGQFRHKAGAEMAASGMPADMIVGEVLECDPPHRLVQTWHPLFNAAMAAEAPTRLTYELAQSQAGECTLSIIHEVAAAPIVAGMVPGGGDPAQGGGGWPWVLSDLKSLLETGARMPS